MSTMTGHDVAERIKRNTDQARRQVEASERQIQMLRHQLSNLDARKKGLINSISRWRTEHLLNGGKADDINAQIINMLERRNHLMAEAKKGLDEVIKQIDQTRVMQRTNEKMANQRQAEADKEQESNTELVALRTQVNALARMIPEQTELLDNIRDECRAKLHGYAACELFSHLNKRHYATDKYKGFGPFKLMDGWLAKTIDYTQMVRDHSVLKTLPTMAEKQLDETTTQYNALRKEMEALLYRLDHASGVTEANQRLKRSTDQLEQLEREKTQLLSEIESFQTNKDANARSIEKTLTNNLLRLSPPTLKRMAKQATSAAESSALKEYVELMDEETPLQESIRRAKSRVAETQNDLERLERLGEHFKKHRFHRANVVFRHSFEVDRFIGLMGDEDQIVRHVHAFSNARQVIDDGDGDRSTGRSSSSSDHSSSSGSSSYGYGGYSSGMDSGSSGSCSGGGSCE